MQKSTVLKNAILIHLLISIFINPLASVYANDVSIDDLLIGGGFNPKPIVNPAIPVKPIIDSGVGKLPDLNTVGAIGAEFQCPMFSTSPLSDIQKALGSLQSSFSSSTTCAKEVTVPIKQKTELISKLVTEIQAEKDLWGSEFENAAPLNNDIYEKKITDLNAKMEKVINSTEEIYSLVQNNILTNEKCAEELTQTEKIIFGVNDLMQGLAPIALKVVSSNPSFAPALPYVFGASLVSSGITAIKSMADETKKLDLSKEVNRRTLIQNVCSFIRVYRSVNYLQLAKERRLEELNTDFLKDIKLYSKSIKLLSTQVKDTIQKQQNIEQNLSPYVNRLLVAKQNLESIQLQNQGGRSDLVSCAIGKSLFKNYKKQSEFPYLILEDFRALSQMTGNNLSVEIQIEVFQDVQNDIIKNIERLSSANNNELKQCAGLSEAWVKEIEKTVRMNENQIKQIKSKSEKLALTNPDYSRYVSEKEKIQAHEINKARLQKILEEMENNPSIAQSIERSEIARKKSDVIEALFGYDLFAKKDQPVKRWLLIQENSFQNMKFEFLKQFEYLRTKQIELAPHIKTMTQPLLQTRMVDLKNLKFINFNTVKKDSEGHKKVCRDMEITYTKFAESVDYLASIQYMCDMIKPVLYEPTVDQSLKSYCLDSISYTSKLNKLAKYKENIKTLIKHKELAHSVRVKLKELQCQSLTVL